MAISKEDNEKVRDALMVITNEALKIMMTFPDDNKIAEVIISITRGNRMVVERWAELNRGEG